MNAYSDGDHGTCSLSVADMSPLMVAMLGLSADMTDRPVTDDALS